MFNSNNGSAYQQRTNGSNGNNNGNSNGNKSNRNGGNQQSGSGGQRKPNPAFGKICHYCKKKNHFQTDCFKRKRDNAPLVKIQELNGQEEEGKNVETVFRSKN